MFAIEFKANLHLGRAGATLERSIVFKTFSWKLIGELKIASLESRRSGFYFFANTFSLVYA